jgi:hypothetical protein
LCGAVEDVDPEKLKAQQEQERLQREVTYTMADGSPIYNPDVYSRTNIRYGRTFAMPGSGRTISIKDAVIDKLRMKDGRTREMDAIFKAQDEQMTARGRKILEDRVELRRSDNIKSSDELRAEKAGTVSQIMTPNFFNQQYVYVEHTSFIIIIIIRILVISVRIATTGFLLFFNILLRKKNCVLQ